jgi:hypothetical protein
MIIIKKKEKWNQILKFKDGPHTNPQILVLGTLTGLLRRLKAFPGLQKTVR